MLESFAWRHARLPLLFAGLAAWRRAHADTALYQRILVGKGQG
jgi:hypothetical protein